MQRRTAGLAIMIGALGGTLPVSAVVADDRGVVGTKLVVVDKLAAAGKAKLAFVSLDPAGDITKGAGTDVGQISAQVDLIYENLNATGAFILPAGASDGTTGWVVNKDAVAKYVNKQAPNGPTQAKVAVVKPGKLLKLVGKGLGDVALDILGAGEPAGSVFTAYCVRNAGEVFCHCSEFAACAYKLIAGGTGAKLVCKSGVPDDTCVATTPDEPIPPEPPVLYTTDRTHSPITPDIVTNLEAIAAVTPRAEDVFATVGDDHSVSSHFLECFSGSNVDYDGREALDASRIFFGGGDAAGTSPWQRTSFATGVGWTSAAVLAGVPSALEQEVAAVDPRYAVVMLGTNDIATLNVFAYADDMLTIVDQLTAGGVIPLLSSIPPRDDDPNADEDVPRYNAAARAVAQARQVPFVDLERELRTLGDHGLASDGVHLTTYNDGASAPCIFSTAGLQYGYNVRNLLTLEVLDRARRALALGNAPDADASRLVGDGTESAPVVVSVFPFSDVRDTTEEGTRNIDAYPCLPGSDQSGPEIVYRLDFIEPTNVRAFVFDQGSVDIDLHLLDSSLTGTGCIQSADGELAAAVAPGTYYLIADTFVSSGTERAGEYILAVLRE